MKKRNAYFWISAIIFVGCSSEQTSSDEGSKTMKLFQCHPTLIQCDTLPQPKLIPLEYDDLETHKLEFSQPGEPLLNEYPFGPGIVHELEKEKLISKYPGDGQTEECASIELTATRKRLQLPDEVEVPHLFSPRENALSFLSIGKLEGLRHSVVSDITQDFNGHIWMATEGGLSKYDGNKLSHYTVSQSLSSNVIYALTHDSKGRIWSGTYKNGFDILDGHYVSHYGKAEGFEDATVLAFLEDREGNMWIGTDGRWFGLWKFDGQRFFQYKPSNGMPIIRIEDLMQDHSGNIWIAGREGVVKFDGKSFLHYSKENGLPFNFITSLSEDQSHKIWMGGNEGLISFDGNTFRTYNAESNLISDQVISVNCTNNGDIWVGHDKGISIIKGEVCQHLEAKSGLPSKHITKVFQDDSDQIWIGTRTSGIVKFMGNIFRHFSSRNGLSGDDFTIYSIYEDTEGKQWIGADPGIGVLDNEKVSFVVTNDKIPINNVRAISQTRSGTLCFGCKSGLILNDKNNLKIINRNLGDIKAIEDFSSAVAPSIYSLFIDNSSQIWVGTKFGVSKYDKHNIVNYNGRELGFPLSVGGSNLINADQFKQNCRVYGILQDREGSMWFLINGYGLVKYDGLHFLHYNTENGLPNKNLQCLAIDQANRLWIGSEIGLMVLENDQIHLIDENYGLSNPNVQAIQFDSDGNLWIGTRDGLNKLLVNQIEALLSANNPLQLDFFKKYGYDDGLITIGVSRGSLNFDSKNNLWMGGNNFLTKHFPEKDNQNSAPKIEFTSLDMFNDKIPWGDFAELNDTTFTVSNGMSISGFSYDSVSLWYQLPINASFKYNNNFLTFNFVGATTYQPEQVKYQYMLEGWDESWSGVSSRTSAPYGNLPPGDYTFKVKARSSSGVWSEPLHYSFTIRPPWFWNVWSKLAYILSVVTTITLVFRWRTGELRKRQTELEDTVRERTSEIAKKHREITDSINYAERIQRSLMASRQLLDSNLPEHFVYFNPKERVSGDFFWACKLSNGRFALACADSTGHGVPGAIMSMLNIAALERAVDGEGLTEPNLILDSARKKVIKTLAQDGSEEGGRDGMDAVLVTLDMAEKKIVAALANMQLWIMGSGEKRTIAPDKMPIGKHDKQDIPFTRHEVQLKKGDVVYMFSDGYVDQFGGPNGKKFKYRPFEELLFSIHQLPVKEQQVIIRMHFENWMGDLEQVDDVCVIGIRMQ